MSENLISSRSNQRVRHARRVRDGQSTDEIFVEGVRLCEQAAHANLVVTEVIHTPEVADDERAKNVLSELKATSTRMTVVSETVYSSITDTKTPQGIALLAKRPDTDQTVVERGIKNVPLLLIMHRLNNPSNAGAIVRAAEAAGVTGIVASNGTTDLFSPKALRGAMGSSFRLPIWAGVPFETILDWCKTRSIGTVCADIRAEREHTGFDWTLPRALIVGGEANGLSADEVALANDAVRIPMYGPVESLNVAVASAVILFEAMRQRRSSIR